MTRDELADSLGFYPALCPNCGKRIWVESACCVECNHCGWVDTEEKDADLLQQG